MRISQNMLGFHSWKKNNRWEPLLHNPRKDKTRHLGPVWELPAFSPAISQRDPQVALFSSACTVQELYGVSGEEGNHYALSQVDSSWCMNHLIRNISTETQQTANVLLTLWLSVEHWHSVYLLMSNCIQDSMHHILLPAPTVWTFHREQSRLVEYMIRVGTLHFICFPPNMSVQYSTGSHAANSVLTDRALIESLPGKSPTYHFEWIKQEMDQIHRAWILNVGFQLCLAWKNNCLHFNFINSN